MSGAREPEREHRLLATVSVLFERGGCMLLLKRSGTGYLDGYYSLVGGHVDGGETLAEAAAREVWEEAGVRVAASDLRLAHVMHRRKPPDEVVQFFFRARCWEGEPRNAEPGKHALVDWFDRRSLPGPMAPHIQSALDAMERGEAYSAHGW